MYTGSTKANEQTVNTMAEPQLGLSAIERASLSICIYLSLSPVLHSISSSVMLSENPSHVFCTGPLECTSSQCHIKIPTSLCLWTQIKILLFTQQFDPSQTAHTTLIFSHRSETTRPVCCADCCVICASSIKRQERREKG